MRLLIITFVPVFFIYGCASYSTGSYGTYAPSVANGFKGLIGWEVEEDSELLRVMQKHCAHYGGLNFSSIAPAERPPGGAYLTMKYRSYQCNGFDFARPKIAPVAPVTYTPGEKNNSPPSKNLIELNDVSPPESLKVKPGLEDAKKKCIDLGFKPATEKFGQCVLRLSK